MWKIGAVAVAWLAGASLAAADESPRWVELLRPDSLLGWEHGSQQPRHWSIADGVLSGTADAAPLLSGWTLGDFELRWQWAVADGGELIVALPQSPSGPGLEWSLAEGDSAGQVRDGQRVLLAGTRVAPRAGGFHSARIVRRGERCEWILDERALGATQLAAGRRFGLSLAVRRGVARLAKLQLLEPAGEPIFNGRDLAGWWSPAGLASWGIEQGTLACLHKGGNYLRTERQWANFTLALEYLADRGVNSGIGIRTARNGWPSGDGIELQIYDHQGIDKHATMALYGNVEPVARADRSRQWNQVVVKAEGRMISAWVNGQLVQHADTARTPELQHRPLRGWVGLQDHGGHIRFRNLAVLAAPDGLGLEAWRAPRAEPATQTILDRLMNSRRLAEDDGYGARHVSRTAASAAEVLAEMPGPGALVRLWHSAEHGTLEFYFDGESSPRLRGPVSRLPALLPLAGEDAHPLNTCLAFQQSLRVVLRDAPGARYRLDFVTAPTAAPLASFRPADPGIPRGLLSALNYRYHQLTHGTHRDHDSYERPRAEPRALAPGERRELLRLEGSGVALWTRLLADPEALKGDDLWLAVTVDGESRPALAAPARFWFPMLAGGANRPNFVMTHREGPTNLLAMPFAEGLALVAENRGSRPIAGVGATLSVAREEAAAIPPLRLRGQFRPADGSTELARLEGSGRWIGLVAELRAAPDGGLRSVVVDGRQQEDWACDSLDEFWGVTAGEAFPSRSLGGRDAALAWRYLLSAPVEFRQSLVLSAGNGAAIGGRLALAYARH